LHIKDLFPHKEHIPHQFLKIWGLSVFGNLFIFFLSRNIHELPLTISFSFFILWSLFFGMVAHFGVKLVTRTDLGSLKSHNFIRNDIIPAIVGSALAIIGIFLLNRIMIKIPVEDLTFLDSSPFWAKLISSFYEGINLEILFRLFLLTLIYFLLTKLFKKKEFRKYIIWTSILLSALVPALNSIYVDHLTLSRLLISNLVGGTVYGYLFVYRSFWAGAIAHFLVDFLLNGI
jgi:hypothetical protein